MELVGYRFFFVILSLVLIILCMVVPYANIEAEIRHYDDDTRAAAFLEQALIVNLLGAVAVVCISLEMVELFCAVSLLLRFVWNCVRTVRCLKYAGVFVRFARVLKSEDDV